MTSYVLQELLVYDDCIYLDIEGELSSESLTVAYGAIMSEIDSEAVYDAMIDRVIGPEKAWGVSVRRLERGEVVAAFAAVLFEQEFANESEEECEAILAQERLAGMW